MKWVKKKPLIRYSKHDDIVTKLCKINGIADVDEFINPTPSSLYDPYWLDNIQEAAEIIADAIINNKKIAVSMDIDADGLTAGAIIYRYIKLYNDNVYIMYAQRTDGHGIENQMEMFQKDTDLVIICDSSTNSVEACRKITKFGSKVVILDHHQKEKDNPYAVIVNPQLCDYPNKELSGAGVVYKALLIVNALIGKYSHGAVDYFLDLVAVGLSADVMSMKEPENRYLVSMGLKNIRNPGLVAIFKEAKKDTKRITTTDIGFLIGPMINGAARMENIELAINLLTSDDELECKKLAKEIKALNEKRKKLEAYCYNLVLDQINPDDNVIVVIHNGIEKSFNGLIATKIANEFKRPAIVMADTGDRYAGSYRTYGDFNMKAFLESLPEDCFVAGHAGAGGFAISKDKLDIVKARFEHEIERIEVEPTIEYDLEIDASEISTDFIREVEKFDAITGKDIQPAKFLVKNVFVNDVEVIGKNKDTVKVISNNLVAMKFRANEEYANNFEPFGIYDFVGSLNVNEFYNFARRELVITNQIFIEDFREST